MSKTLKTKTANGLTLGMDTDIRMVFPLTTCCEATAKGLEDCIGCRACYREIDPLYGDCVILTEDRDAAVERMAVWIETLEELHEVTREAAHAQAELALQDLTRKAGWT